MSMSTSSPAGHARRAARILPLIALPLLLAACAAPSPSAGKPPADPAPTAGRCNATPAQFALGRQADAAVQADARTRAGARIVRVLRPDQVVTMEFNAERLNLAVDANGKVTRVSCG